MTKIYLDYAATTPVDPAVARAMQPYFGGQFGNPGSLHSFGQEAIAAVDRARETIARAFGAGFRQIAFTGSATEANNLALRGVARKFRGTGHEGRKKTRIIISAIEHESVLETANDLERDGIEVVRVPVDARGMVDIKKIKESLTADTALVSVIYAQNEIGTIQPIREIADAVKGFDGGILVHTDAAQALQFLACEPAKLGVDLMTVSSHKIYGPKGAGALYVRDPGLLAPLMTGGGQEFGLRSGTENVPAIVGFAKAVELAAAAREKESARLGALRDRLWKGIKEAVPEAEINGPAAPEEKLPNILNVYFPGHAAQDLLTRLDLAGLAASAGSACRSRAHGASYVLESLGYSRERAGASIRMSAGRMTTEEEIDAAVKLFQKTFVL